MLHVDGNLLAGLEIGVVIGVVVGALAVVLLGAAFRGR